MFAGRVSADTEFFFYLQPRIYESSTRKQESITKLIFDKMCEMFREQQKHH